MASIGIDPAELAASQILRRSLVAADTFAKTMGFGTFDEVVASLDAATKRKAVAGMHRKAKRARTLSDFVDQLDGADACLISFRGGSWKVLESLCEEHGKRWFDTAFRDKLNERK